MQLIDKKYYYVLKMLVFSYRSKGEHTVRYKKSGIKLPKILHKFSVKIVPVTKSTRKLVTEK